MINHYANKICRKLSLDYSSPNSSSNQQIDITGNTIEDIKQELRIRVFLGISRFNEVSDKNPITDPCYNADAACGAMVKSFLETGYKRYLRDLWADKRGQNE